MSAKSVQVMVRDSDGAPRRLRLPGRWLVKPFFVSDSLALGAIAAADGSLIVHYDSGDDSGTDVFATFAQVAARYAGVPDFLDEVAAAMA
jgi:hypothetical protein